MSDVMRFCVNGRMVEADVIGRGDPVVLLHSFPLDRRVWGEQAAALSATHRVIVPDFAGFGGSGDAPASLAMEEYAADVAAILDALGETGRVTLAGLSMGGYVALAFAAADPQRLSRLILCDTRAAADPPEKRAERLQQADAVLRDGAAGFLAGVPAAQLCGHTRSHRPVVVTAVREMAAAATSAGVAAALRGMAARPDRSDLLRTLNVPTLLLCGEQDALTPPAEMRAIASTIPRARFVMVPQAGHLAPLENPQPVTTAIRDFLTTG